ncbi:MAG: antibiotic biosynthesis monooxygenase [Desulfobacteraceae bacterium]|nr:antibiotic biosynthesis monooxygenase [Desulfobacteraceae bacterium]
MSIKVLIKRAVPEDKAKAMIPLFRQMRELAMGQPGYISGETLRNLENPLEFMVISNWQHSSNWAAWLESPARKQVQAQIDKLLGGETQYDIFHYGFSE